jgi:FKBP-type peptidyl-prolyl cis-trans isomerase FklB
MGFFLENSQNHEMMNYLLSLSELHISPTRNIMNKIIISLIALALALIMSPSLLAEPEISTDKQKLSYALGIFFSQGITQQNVELDTPAFLQAVEDALNGNQLKLSPAEIQQVLTDYQQQLATQRATIADSNKAAGEKFLKENSEKEDVVKLPSGLQYKIIKEGSGQSPSRDSSVKVHYQGTLINGKVFDSSYERGEPVTLALNQVIKGWQEVLPLMNIGSKWQIYVPPELAYDQRGAGNSIGPNETLIFDIELLEIR